MQYRLGLGIACALVAAVCYGIIPPFSRAAFEGGVPPVESTFLRTFFIAVAMAIVAVLRAERFVLKRPGWPSFLAQALSTAAVSICYIAAVQFIPVSLSTLIFYTFPVLILLVAPAVEGRRPGLMRIAVALVAFAGLAIAVGPSFDRLDWRGLALSGAASLCAVVQAFSGRALSRYLAPAAMAALVQIAAWPITLAVALIVGGGAIGFFPGGAVTAAGYAFLVGVAGFYFFAYGAHMLSLRMAPASVVAPYFNLEPMVTTGVAVTLLGESPTLQQGMGGALVLGALLLSGLVERIETGKPAYSPH